MLPKLWRLARGDTRTFERAIVQLRAGTSEANLAYTVQLCAGLLDVMRSALNKRDVPVEKLERLDSLVRAPQEHLQALVHVANLQLARLQESRGNLTGALRAPPATSVLPRAAGARVLFYSVAGGGTNCSTRWGPRQRHPGLPALPRPAF